MTNPLFRILKIQWCDVGDAPSFAQTLAASPTGSKFLTACHLILLMLGGVPVAGDLPQGLPLRSVTLPGIQNQPVG